MNKGWSKRRTKVEAAEQHNLHISHSSFKNRPNRVNKEKVGKISTKKKEKEYPMPPYLLLSFFFGLPHSPNNEKRPTFRAPPTGVPFTCFQQN